MQWKQKANQVRLPGCWPDLLLSLSASDLWGLQQGEGSVPSGPVIWFPGEWRWWGLHESTPQPGKGQSHRRGGLRSGPAHQASLEDQVVPSCKPPTGIKKITCALKSSCFWDNLLSSLMSCQDFHWGGLKPSFTVWRSWIFMMQMVILEVRQQVSLPHRLHPAACGLQHLKRVYCVCRWSSVMQVWLSSHQRSCFRGAAWLSRAMGLLGGWRGTGSFLQSMSPRTHEDRSPRTSSE